MHDPAARNPLARLDAALARIEALARQPAASATDADQRYQTLRRRTQAALASLETVIAKVAGGAERR